MTNAVAIVGMAGRFPGAGDLDAYWTLIRSGAVVIRRSGDAALEAAGFGAAKLADPGFVAACGVLDGVDRFDAAFFGYPAARAAALDPQQRLLLEVAWHALEDAGYGPGSAAAGAVSIGAYLSMASSTYGEEPGDDLGDGFFALTSRDKDYAATRIAYKLDLTGPALMVQTACSGSLAAVHLAVEALLSGQCDMAIAGGCSVTLPQGGYRRAEGLMLSASGAVRPFDATADGAVPGNGLGVVVLKPLTRALADGDAIRAVILGSAINNDGAHKADYLAPSVRGQARVVGEALSVAGVAASSIGFVECHGTGTALGDPVELRALDQAFRAAGAVAASGATALGAVKAAIGHLNVASGIAGLIKVVLALQHRILPPNPWFRSANSGIDFAATPFRMEAAASDWMGLRRAGVSSFGFGGTNVHVVLEQAPTAVSAAGDGPAVLRLSAKTAAALAQMAAALADALEAAPGLSLADVAHTLAAGRQVFEYRLAVAAVDRSDAIRALRAGAPTVAWPEQVRAGRMVRLPGYPFAPTVHWRGRAAAVARPGGGDVPALQAIFGAALDAPPGSLDPDATYDQFGIDSLMVGTITAELRQRFPVLRSTALFEHDTLRRLAAHLAVHGTPAPVRPATRSDGAIAVIGLAGRYPGARNIDALWMMLSEGRTGIVPVPAERWTGGPPRWGGFIEDADRFDPLFFGIAPREARMIDPQARLFLQVAWSAIEDAGYTRAALRGDVGVFAGVMNQPYRLLGLAAAEAGMVVQANHWSVANRVSYHLDFKGPSIAVDTGCSASLTAVHLACESLRRGECGVALAGGVNLVLHPVQQTELARTGVLASGADCAVFGAAADGFVQGEGVGVAVLKPLARALADGDFIHGVILGSAINSGGKTGGYTVPSPAAQAAVVQAAVAASGVAADSIGYVECHGTATALGDPIEIAGLADGLHAAGRGVAPCVIGSAKANIGHTESAAGIAGLTKLLLQMRHRAFVPSPGAAPANPAIDFAQGPFTVLHATAPWTAAVRRGGLSSFGAGGANGHLVAEEAPSRVGGGPGPATLVFPLSARTEEALVARRLDLAAWLDGPEGAAADLADLAYTLTVGREAMEVRAAYVAADAGELAAALRADRRAGGDAVAREAAFAGARRLRLRLPTYAFARERCWLPDVSLAESTGAHPWLRAARPSLVAEARWPVVVAQGHALLVDHVVGGRAMLPGVAALELALAAARTLGHVGPLSLCDVRWRAPCVPDGGLTAELVLRADGDEMAFELSSGGVVHVSGRVVAGGDGLALAGADPIATTMTADEVYARFGSLGLEYGPAFRSIRTMRVGPEGSVAELVCPPGVWAGTELPPGLLDGVLQAAAMAVFVQPGAARLLPMSVDRVAVLGRMPERGVVQARLISAGRDFAQFDAVLRDEAGQVVLALEGLAGRIDRAVETVPEGWFYAPEWRARPGQAVAAAVRSVLVAASSEALSVPEGLSVLRLGRLDGDPADEAGWRLLLASGVGQLVWAMPSEPDEGEAATLHLFRALKALRAVRGFAPTRVVVAGLADAPGVAAAWTAAARALARVAAREWADWTVVPATLDSWDALPAAMADAADPDGLELLWRGGVRHARVLCPARLEPTGPGFRENGAYLIVGGGGGIGQALALRVARSHRARFALVGRHPATPAQEAAMEAIRAAGGDAVHLVADATRPGDLVRAVAEARARFGVLHGAIHAAIVMEDRSLELMSEEVFRQGLDVKTRGVLALADAVADAGLDWLALFSSVNAFVANAGQANYVAGCAFKDAYGLALRARGVPVRVIDWGFWGEVGRVADDAYRGRLARRGVHAIGTEDGLAAAEAMLAAGLPQVVALKADGAVLRAMGLVADASASLAPLVAATAPFVEGQRAALAGSTAAYEAMETLSRRRLAWWWAQTGSLRDNEALSEIELAARVGVVPRHRRLFTAMLDALMRENAVRFTDGRYRLGDALARPDLDAFRVENPAMAPHVALLEACASAYSSVLRGEALGTEIMFPESSLALVEGIYRGNRVSDYCNALVGTLVAAAVAQRPAGARVLEIGAGTGGTTSEVAPRLAGFAGLEYVYTDISIAFTKAGKRRFAEVLPGLVCRTLDIGQDPAGQDVALAGCDVVLGANVVHATPDLVRSLSHACALLKPGGVLVLYELTALHDFGTMTFGLLDGWWMARDERLPHAPLLDVRGWRQRLAAAGFGDVAAFSTPDLLDETSFRHAVIVARKPEAVAAPKAAASVRERLRRRVTEAAVAVSAPSALIETIRAVVAEVLEMRLEDVKTGRSFADFGADSILGVSLVEALGKRLGVALSPTVLFSHQTVEKLAAHLAGAHGVVVQAEVATPPPTPQPLPDDAIAIVGWSGRFPGARTIEAFWANAVAGVDSVGPVPSTRWDHDAVYDPAPNRPGRTNCRDGGFIDDAECFDPLFFGLSPAEATAMDPQARVFLEEAWQALEDAGYAAPGLDGTPTGVFVGTVAGDYEQRLKASGRVPDAHSFMGAAPSMLAARIAYRLNLRGPCLSVDTACSSSLVAVHLACESLRRGESAMALAGGVAVMTTPGFYLAGASAGMLSPSGRCRTLDAAADGFVPAEAVAVVVLKRLSDALRDGDQVHAVIRANGMNQDGASNGITAPNGAAQTALIRQVQAGIAPGNIGYVELHGTGTRLGDPIELDALRDAMGPADGRAPWCGIGSSKAAIGHALPAAGVVGLIRAALAVRHRLVPPVVHLAALNPHIGLDGTPFTTPARATPWPDGPVCSAVSAFGFSGTNAHVVLQAAPPLPAIRAAAGLHVAVLSAETETALRQRAVALAAWLRAYPDAEIADVCFTLGAGRTAMRVRAAFEATDCAGLVRAIEAGQGAEGDVAAQFLAGQAVDWSGIYPPGSARRVGLPGYPFARRRCWPEDVQTQRSVFNAVIDALMDGD